jgi:AAA domain, putative AbiEii toxin, Type IV TA system
LRDFAALNESVRHDFRGAETSLELLWKNKCKLRVIWPEVQTREDSETPFFYLLDDVGNVPRSPTPVRAKFSTIGVIPTLSPLEHEEAIVEDETVRRNLASRLSSRNFRNQLRMLVENGGWDDFIDFAAPWLAEVQLTRPVIRYETSSIDVFFTEIGSRIEKELVWAGDGIQIWLQLLLHIYRAQYLPTLVLDEPEVFLHPDLQRRLVRLLDSLETQIILATHSTEVLAEAERRAILWVDKTQRAAVRAPEHAALTELDTALGTAFNLAMAKALRARGVLFVEGKDTKLLKRLAETLRISSLSDETTLAIVPMNGFSKWDRAQAFGWFLREFLGNSVKALVLLDRDYRTNTQVSDVVAEFATVDVHVHVWKKKELESYLLIPSAIARLGKCTIEEVTSVMDQIMDDMRNKVTSRLLSERIDTERSTGKAQ